MKLNKLFSTLMLISAIAFAACNNSNIPDGPGSGPEGNGNNENPSVTNTDTLSVADVLAMNVPAKDAGVDKYIVKAYIVGSYNFDNDPKWVIGAENAANTSLLLADDPESTDTYNVMSIKLENGIFRTSLNLVDNPANYKKEIILVGVLEKYCGINGMVKLEKAVIDGQTIENVGSNIPVSNDGTEEHPYTASDIITLNNSKTGNYYVKAYIVGQVAGGATSMTNSSIELKAPFTDNGNGVNTNILIADAQDEENDLVPVQLPSNLREFSLPAQPENIGKEIIIYGSLEKYFGKAGVKSITYAKVGDKEYGTKPGETPDITDGGAVTVADFLTKADNNSVWYTLTGTISNITNTTYGNFDLVDETGSVYVYGLTATQQISLINDKSFSTLGLNNGDNITICGPKTTYNGKVEVNCAYLVMKN